MRLTKHLVGLICALAAAAWTVPAEAQVNVEPLRQQLKSGGFGARLRASMTSSGGNTERFVMGGGLLVGGQSRPHLAYLNVTGDYASVERTVQVAKAFSHLRYNYELAPWLWAEAFAQLEADRFRRITRRQLVGLGPRVGYDGERGSAVYGTSYMAEWTLLDRRNTSDSGALRLSHRWNHYVSASVSLDERVLLSTTFYYQPRFDDPADYHALAEQALEFEVTELLRTGIDLSMRYESRPAEEVESLDYTFRNSLSLAF